MKNIILKVFVVVCLLGSIFILDGSTISVSSKNVYLSNSGDIRPPSCSVFVPKKIKIGDIVFGSIVCHDENGLSSTIIRPSDLEVRNVFIKRIKILEVSEPLTGDGMTYNWTIKIKGNFFGSTSISLKPSSVYDKAGNGNSSTIPQYISVKFR